MNDAPERSDPEPQPPATPYLRLPMPLVAGALLVFLVGLLALGLYANRNLRPQGIVVPTAAVQATPSETPPAVAGANLTVTPAPAVATTAPTPLILVEATPTPAPPALTPVASVTPVLQVPSQSPTPLPTVDPTLAAEVGKSYEQYWRVSSQALLDLDATRITEVMDGEYLMTFQEKLQSLRASGRAIKTQVSLHYKVIQASDISALIVDRVADDSFYVTLGDNTPLSDPTDDVLNLQTKLHKFDGIWKVVEIVSAD